MLLKSVSDFLVRQCLFNKHYGLRTMQGWDVSLSLEHRSLADSSDSPVCLARNRMPNSVVIGETSGAEFINSLGNDAIVLSRSSLAEWAKENAPNCTAQLPAFGPSVLGSCAWSAAIGAVLVSRNAVSSL